MKPAMEEEFDFTVTAASSPDLRRSGDDDDLSIPVVKLFNNNNNMHEDEIATLKSRIHSTTNNTISDKTTTNCYKDFSYALRKNPDELFTGGEENGIIGVLQQHSEPAKIFINGTDDVKKPSNSNISSCYGSAETSNSLGTTIIGGHSGPNISTLPNNYTRSPDDRYHTQGSSSIVCNQTSGCNTDSTTEKNLENGDQKHWEIIEPFCESELLSEQTDRLTSIDLNSDDGDDVTTHQFPNNNIRVESQGLSTLDCKPHDPQRSQSHLCSSPQTLSSSTPTSVRVGLLQQERETEEICTRKERGDNNNKSHSANNRSLELPLTNGLTQLVESNFSVGGAVNISSNSHNSNIGTPGTSCATTPSMSPIDDVTVMVGKNGKLSTVLENIPLLYIPTTKQLVSKDWPRVGHTSPPQHDIKYVPMTRKYATAEDCLGSTNNKDYAEVRSDFTNSLHRIDASSLSNLSSGRDYTDHEPGLLCNSSSLHRVDASSLSSLNGRGGRNYSEVRTTGSLHQVDDSSLSSISTGTDLACGGSVDSEDYPIAGGGGGTSGCCSSSPGVNFHTDEHHHPSCSGVESALGCGTKSKCSNPSKASSLDSLESSLVEVNLFSRNSFEPRSRSTSASTSSSTSSSKSQEKKTEHNNLDFTKRKGHGITGFLGRNLFRRSKESSTKQSAESAPGWKLFGRIPPKESTLKDPNQICDEYHAKQKASQLVAARARKDIEVMSTTALILENRPGNLPSKAPEEERKHKQEYEAMVEAAKRKEQKDIRQKKKHLQQQLKHEEQLMAAAKTWNSEVLPNWEVTKQTKRARDLWWNGLPPSVRGRVWKLAIGNELNITSELYEICLNRAKDRIQLLSEESHGLVENSAVPPSNKEASVELIKLDVSRTFPQFCIFQKGGPYHDLLHSLLGAYACYRPDVGYVQGMSFLAAVLLLNMDVADAFICFANLLNGPCQVAFFRVDEGMMKSYFDTYDEFFLENMPQLHQHFEKQSLTPDIYIIDWIFTIFSRSLPLDVACRVWDVFCRDGEEFLFRTALGILHLYENILLNMDFIHLAQFLTKLPEDICADQLFRNIQVIRLSIDKKKFAQVLSGHREARERSDYF